MGRGHLQHVSRSVAQVPGEVHGARVRAVPLKHLRVLRSIQTVPPGSPSTKADEEDEDETCRDEEGTCVWDPRASPDRVACVANVSR